VVAVPRRGLNYRLAFGGGGGSSGQRSVMGTRGDGASKRAMLEHAISGCASTHSTISGQNRGSHILGQDCH
jgi:hypothetical protein